MNRNIGPGLRRTALALAIGFALAGCAPIVVGTAVVGTAMVATDRRTTAAQLEDEVIEHKAKNRIEEVMGDRGQVSATSYNRVLLLTGNVPELADKAKVEQVVSGVENVQSVVNELAVGFPRSFSTRSNDAFITSKVKASLVDAQDVFSNSVKVETSNGVVYLMGRVTERESERAAEVARGVADVKKVVKVFQIISEAELAKTQTKAPNSP